MPPCIFPRKRRPLLLRWHSIRCDHNLWSQWSANSGNRKIYRIPIIAHTCIATSHTRQEKLHFRNSANGRKKILEFNTPATIKNEPYELNEWANNMNGSWRLGRCSAQPCSSDGFFPPFFLSIDFFSFLFDEWPVYYMLVFSVVHLAHMYMLNECCIVAASVQRKNSARRKIYLYIHTRVHISNAYMYTPQKKYGRWEDTHTIMWWKRASNLCQEAAQSSRPFHTIIIIVLSKCVQCAHVIYLIASTVAAAAAVVAAATAAVYYTFLSFSISVAVANALLIIPIFIYIDSFALQPLDEWCCVLCFVGLMVNRFIYCLLPLQRLYRTMLLVVRTIAFAIINGGVLSMRKLMYTTTTAVAVEATI